MTCLRSLLASLMFAMLVPATALASPLLELIGDVSGQGGLNARASSPGAASTYFNPALLSLSEPGLTVGVFTLAENMNIRLDARGRRSTCRPAGPRGSREDMMAGLRPRVAIVISVTL